MTRPSNQATGNVEVDLLLKFSSTTNPGTNKGTVIVQEGQWINNGTQVEGQITTNVSTNEIQVVGSSIYIKSTTSSNVESDSCEYPIEKDQVPTFTLSPSTTTVSCGSTSAKTFTVTNVYNSPGILSYNWQVGSGWNNSSGNPVSTFTTTTNSVTLTPYLYPPSNVKVTPVLDGVNQPQLTSTVSLSGFNPTFYEVTGPNSLCSSANYSVSNLPNYITVTSWSVTNNGLASLSFTGNQATLTALSGNGVVTLSAVITNSCNQTKTISKQNIAVGVPTPNGSINSSGDDELVAGPTDSAVFSISTKNINGLSSVSWVVYSNTDPNAASYFTIQTQGNGSTAIVQAAQITPEATYTMQGRLTNNCGFYPVDMDFDVVSSSGSPVITRMSNNYNVYPNPSKDFVNIDLVENIKHQTKNDIKISGELFDALGRSKLKIDMQRNGAQFSVARLNPGIYVLKIYLTDTIETHQIVVK